MTYFKGYLRYLYTNFAISYTQGKIKVLDVNVPRRDIIISFEHMIPNHTNYVQCI